MEKLAAFDRKRQASPSFIFRKHQLSDTDILSFAVKSMYMLALRVRLLIAFSYDCARLIVPMRDFEDFRSEVLISYFSDRKSCLLQLGMGSQ